MKTSCIKVMALALLLLPVFGRAQQEVASPMPTQLRTVHIPGSKVLTSHASPACPDGLCPGLGNSFYLPETNTLSSFTGGNTVFKSRKLGDCVTVSSAETAHRELTEISSMEQFTRNTMASADLSGSYSTAALTVKGTATAMTGSRSDTTSTFHSTTLDITMIKNSIDFVQDAKCFSADNVVDSFRQAFESLPAITDASDASAWSPYVEFLKSSGSHIMLQQQIGSRFQQWDSSTSDASDIESTLKAKACAEVEGISAGGGWSVSGCAAYSEDEKKKALKTSSFSKRVIEGGSVTARNNITKEVNKQTIDAFIDSAEEGTEAVRFIFKPLWQLMYVIYAPTCDATKKDSPGCKNLQRAFNLQAAYEGWTAVGCEKKVSGGQVYQQMAISGQTALGTNTYSCKVMKTGCKSDDSCHLGGGGSVCYCYGDQCIDTGENIIGTTMSRDVIRGNQSGSYNEGVNNSCYYKFIAHCNCDTSWAGGLPDRTLYQQSSP